jgi:tRNA nucleotidyltransferase (CCA-adding enzyme)
LKPKTIVKVLEKTDAFRNPKRFDQYLLACEADFRGRIGFEERAYPQAKLMKRAFSVCNKLSINAIINKGFVGKEIGEQVHSERVKAVAILLKT